MLLSVFHIICKCYQFCGQVVRKTQPLSLSPGWQLLFPPATLISALLCTLMQHLRHVPWKQNVYPKHAELSMNLAAGAWNLSSIQVLSRHHAISRCHITMSHMHLCHITMSHHHVTLLSHYHVTSPCNTPERFCTLKSARYAMYRDRTLKKELHLSLPIHVKQQDMHEDQTCMPNTQRGYVPLDDMPMPVKALMPNTLRQCLLNLIYHSNWLATTWSAEEAYTACSDCTILWSR